MTIREEEDALPSAPPLQEHIPIVPVVQAEPIQGSVAPAAASATASAVSAESLTSSAPRPPPKAAVPPGMVANTVTTTYPDGRQVTVTDYVPAPGSAGAAAPVAVAATPVATSTHHPPRRDLGARPVSLTCPYCAQTGRTRTNQDCGDCTWISVIILLLCCFPFFWIPFICPSCLDTQHYCRSCGRIVGRSKAECCS
ncbi:hypothetical protein ACHAWF_003939 [Thalassiosira exigua]